MSLIMIHLLLVVFSSLVNISLQYPSSANLSLELNELSTYRNIWSTFKTKHGKIYGNEKMENRRFDTFKNNLILIQKHNLEYQLGLQSYQLSANVHSDLSFDEFKSFLGIKSIKKSDFAKQLTFLSSISNSSSSPSSKDQKMKLSRTKVPPSVDWRKSGKVAPIQDQGSCGSCWAFSAVSAVESLIAIKNQGPVQKLSEQQVVDCALYPEYYGFGCNGGDAGEALRYVMDHGLVDGAVYPYAATMFVCPADQIAKRKRTYIKDYDVKQKTNTEADLVSFVSKQPVGVAIEVSEKFQFYSSGIFDDPKCTGESVDHGVNIIGYDRHSFIVRNTWGREWGEDGYMRIKRGKNVCGIKDHIYYPIV